MTKNINWKNTDGAIWRAKKGHLRAVKEIDTVALNDLVGIDVQKAVLLENTRRFLKGLPANNVLLWGSRGSGKSSLIKAVMNHYKSKGLRIIEIDKDNLDDLVDISDVIRDENYRFVIFCDDLSFEEGDRSYKGLKRIMEGSIEAPPNNVIIYATSNRRHLVPEYMSDNIGTKVGNKGEIHYSDSVEEKISLSDRFGLWLSFYTGDEEQYLKVVDSYFKDYKGEKELLHQEALDFARSRASKSARTAKQFYNSFFKKD
ncbi:MAG: ATP-binding protein [Campylobacterales bacterium]|nr:ATP-binding protein [Campylobacterales bacterium]